LAGFKKLALKKGKIIKSFQHLTGLIAAPFAPLNAEGGLKLDIVEHYAKFLHRNGVQGAFVCGTSGESMSLSVAERMAIAKRWVEVAPPGLRVIVHVGHNALPDSRALAAHAQEIRAWAIAAIAPSFFKPATVADLVNFCAEVAAAAPSLPFYYYHMPAMSGVDFAMVDFLELAESKIPNLAGIKFTHENLMDYAFCLNAKGGRFNMLFGRDEILLAALALGARGAVGSTYNFAAPLYLNLMKAFDDNDLPKARLLQQKAITMISVLAHCGANFISASKAVMQMLGVECGKSRSPIAQISAEQRRKLQNVLTKMGFFDFCAK